MYNIPITQIQFKFISNLKQYLFVNENQINDQINLDFKEYFIFVKVKNEEFENNAGRELTNYKYRFSSAIIKCQ